MTRLALLVSVWLAAFAATLAALVVTDPPPATRGRVVLVSDSACEAVVVDADGGFVVLRRIAGVALPAVDEEIEGPLQMAGVRAFRVAHRGVFAAEVEGRRDDEAGAAELIDESCGPPAFSHPIVAGDLMN